MTRSPSTSADLAALADQCVMCGLCLPYCPTYAAGREEGESPRGRIALIKALAEDRMPATPTLVEHLESCLACRRCETVCPANVRYGELIAGVRALPALARCRPRWRRLLDRWLTRPRRLRALLALRPALGLVRAWSRRGRSAWAKRARFVDALPKPRPPAGPAPARATGAPAAGGISAPDTVVLFAGCVGAPYEAALRAGATRLLAALGVNSVPAGPGLCCGSLARFAGDVVEAAATEARLIEGLRAHRGRRLLGTATGCQQRLAQLAPAEVEIDELHVFLADHPALPALRFQPRAARVAVHRPCSQRTLGPRSGEAVEHLLGRVPGLERVDLPEQDRCCGAAGSHFLARPTQAEALRGRVLDDIAGVAPDIVVSTNVGCRLFLDADQPGSGRRIPILHPVELLARQLKA